MGSWFLNLSFNSRQVNGIWVKYFLKSHKSSVPLPKCTYYLAPICRHKTVTHMNLLCPLNFRNPHALLHFAVLQHLVTYYYGPGTVQRGANKVKKTKT